MARLWDGRGTRHGYLTRAGGGWEASLPWQDSGEVRGGNIFRMNMVWKISAPEDLRYKGGPFG